ncbi:MAG TPA: glucose 1-dehydrogenase [Bacteroidales bacterium]|nr:glucose 1-dehydrogenase [Bacteroidales bacterium]
MKAIAITPGKGDARLIDIEEPSVKNDKDVKLQVLEVGICGTDREEIVGGRADAPSGSSELVIGHEMLGRVVETGKGVTKIKKGDYAMLMVRRPCNHCPFCLNNRSDMCSSGDYTERGIKGIHGYQTEFVVDHENFVIPVAEEIRDIGVLTEPLSVVIKAVDEALMLQSCRFSGIVPDLIKGKRALVAGLGPIGLLAALVLKLKGADIYGLDIVKPASVRPSIFSEIGGHYINGLELKTENIDNTYGPMDFIFEATGIAKLEFELMDALAVNGVYVLAGIPAGERPVTILGADLMRKMVLKNQVMLGSVNASYDHYIKASEELVRFKNTFSSPVSKLITERVNYRDFRNVLELHSSDEIKAIVEWSR